MRAILDVFDKLSEKYVLLSTTGTASKVMSNATKRKAQTIHRAYYSGVAINENEWVIIDESSLLSLDHFRYLMSMINGQNVKIMLLGDSNQLIPISVGLPFNDIQNLIKIGSLKGKIFELTEIMRAKSDGGIPYISKMFTKFDIYTSGVELEEFKGVQFHEIEKDVNVQVENIITKNNFNLDEVHVLCAKKAGKAGVEEINKHIQSKFNSNKVIYEDKFKMYKAEDIVMHTRNNPQIGVFNGELLKIKEKIGSDYILQKNDDLCEIVYDKETLMTQTMLAYAFTVHKSQGASLKNVICIFPKSHSFLISRNLAYTGISRASKSLHIIKEKDILEKAYVKNDVLSRKTFLGEFLKHKLKK